MRLDAFDRRTLQILHARTFRCQRKSFSFDTSTDKRPAIGSLRLAPPFQSIMPYVRGFAVLAVALAVLGRSTAFTVAPRARKQVIPLQLAKNDGSDLIKQSVKAFGVLSLGSILAFNVADASASSMFLPDDASIVSAPSAILSSSVQLSAEIKTMDMSLPSYGSISDAKNTKESLSTLVIEQPEVTSNVKSKAAPKKGEPMKGPSMSSFLPSLDKKGPKEKAVAQKSKSTEAKEEKTIAGAKVEIVDMNLPTYSGASDTKSTSPFALP